jgi:hypothetical protein
LCTTSRLLPHSDAPTPHQGYVVPVGTVIIARFAKVAELVDALDLGSSGATRESSILSFRTSQAWRGVSSRMHRMPTRERAAEFPNYH